MSEKIIEVDIIDPRDLYGVNNAKLKLIKNYFPKLKLIARGDILKAVGDDGEIAVFEEKLAMLISHLQKYKQLTDVNIERIMEGNQEEMQKGDVESNVILYGNNGNAIRANTLHQRALAAGIEKDDMILAIGPAGTGKTYTAVALAVKALKERQVKRIILTRPAVEAGESLGYLPGDYKEKLDPYLQPLYDALNDMIPAEKLLDYLTNGTVQIAPLAYMRGRTLDKAFVILDEAQNATEMQFKMFVTRMGKSAKFIITGDLSQIDLPKNQPSGLVQGIKVLEGINGLQVIRFDGKDVMRHPLVRKMITAYDKFDKKNKEKTTKSKDNNDKT